MQLLQWLSCLKAGNTPHAVFLTGPDGSGKKEYARQAAALYLLGQEDPGRLIECPFFRELPDYAIDTVRLCCSELNQQVFARGRRCLLIPDAHRMAVIAQNVLLKTLEEPPEGALIILTGSDQAVLPTIRSRCMLVRVGAEDPGKVAARLAEKGVAPDRARLAAALAGGVPSLAERYAGEEYTAFRAACMPVVEEALFGVTPFARAASVLEQREEGKKRVGKDELCDFMDILASVLRDALLIQLGGGSFRNPDARALLERTARHFTTAEIQCMIAEILKKRRLLAENGMITGGTVLDSLLASLKKQEKK